jgi:hypothetical protein
LPARSKTTELIAGTSDQLCAGPQLFALVDICDPDRVYCYGVDVGTQAFTVRCDPESRQKDFGSWISMRSAFERLDSLAGGPGRLALVVFDSAPTVAVTAVGPGGLGLAMIQTNELVHQAQWNGTGDAWAAGERGRDPQASEDQHAKVVKAKTGAR